MSGLTPTSNSNTASPSSRPHITITSHTSNGSSHGGNVSPKAKALQHIPNLAHHLRPYLSGSYRTLSDALRSERNREEQETLLDDNEAAVRDGNWTEAGGMPRPDPHSRLNIYYNIQRIRRLILACIEDPYTMDQLKEPRMNVLIVKPLVDRLYDADDISIVYCLLVNRTQFLRQQHFQHHHQTVNLTRANLCELVALKALRRHDEESTGKQGLLLLANILVAPFQPFQNAPPDICPERRHWGYQSQGGYEGKLTALEVAIVSESKTLLSSSACQKVIDAVYRGRIIYTPTSFLDIIPDNYKYKPISLYDPRQAPLFNQYRLTVPRTRNLVEVTQFVVLLALYCFCMTEQHHADFTAAEGIFMVYASGWVLDECASILEHGWTVHTQELWAFLDVTFAAIYIVYFTLRTYAWIAGDINLGRQAFDILAIASPILFPRLAFNLMPENMLFIALRAMVKEFTALSLIAVWCFAGFLLSLKWLSMASQKGDLDESLDAITISKWMLLIWFGLDATGIEQAPSFHQILGPALMVIYAFLGNMLFLTVLVSILSNSFSKIAADATAEIRFRRAVSTLEGVKSDSIFAYYPPFNILALFLLVPLKFILTPRWFHKINLTLVRVLNAPLLVSIALYERKNLWKPVRKGHVGGPTRSAKSGSSFWNRLNVHGEIQAVFDEEPPAEVLQRIEEEDDLEEAILENSFAGLAATGRSESRDGGMHRRRRLSSDWHG